MSRKSESRPRRFWLIVHGEARGMEVLTIGLAADEKALPVFSFEDEARMFLGLGELDGDWRVRVTTAGELISVLFGPCSGTGRVVLDPLPGSYGALNELVSVGREAFMELIEATSRPGMEFDRPGGPTRAGERRGARATGKMEDDRKPVRRIKDIRQAGATARAATRAGKR